MRISDWSSDVCSSDLLYRDRGDADDRRRRGVGLHRLADGPPAPPRPHRRPAPGVALGVLDLGHWLSFLRRVGCTAPAMDVVRRLAYLARLRPVEPADRKRTRLNSSH